MIVVHLFGAVRHAVLEVNAEMSVKAVVNGGGSMGHAIHGMVPEEKRSSLTAILKGDPRPHYQNDPQRVYGFFFAGLEIKFQVCEKQLTVCAVQPIRAEGSAYPPDCSRPQSCQAPDQQ